MRSLNSHGLQRQGRSRHRVLAGLPLILLVSAAGARCARTETAPSTSAAPAGTAQAANYTASRVGDTHPGIRAYSLKSPFQHGANPVEVLLPQDYSPAKRYPVLYVLPVNTGVDGPWGSPLLEIQKSGLQSSFGVICVCPALEQEPWYGDNPGNPEVRQYSHILSAVVPWVDGEFSTRAEASGRYILGFSKSGLGAHSLFLRNPGTFGRLLTFDSAIGPPSQETFKSWGFATSYGTRENFDLFDPLLLLDKAGPALRDGKRRIVLMAGGPGSRVGVDVLRTKLQDLGVPHVYAVCSNADHNWRSGWLPLGLSLLLSP